MRYYNNNYNQRGGFNNYAEEPSFTSPYNFVPLNQSVLIPWWGDLVSQDRPLVDAESGTISLEITNLTPMFVRDGDGLKRRIRNDAGRFVDYDYSAHVSTPEGKRYFIPGSSLRGMFRSVAEILSFSKLKQYKKDHFSYWENRERKIKYNYSVEKCIYQECFDDNGCNKDTDGKAINVYDMTELLFGFVDSEKALKGRVWIGAAFAQSIVEDEDLEAKMGVLGEPKASFYPHYLLQDEESDDYITYDGIIDGGGYLPPDIAGRKRYRIHSNRYITPIPRGSERMMTKFMVLPKNLKFTLTISFHNLLPEEIGLLLSAITLHGTQGVSHNIGLAKAFGYGKVDIKVKALSGLKYSQEYYLEFFERYINNFTKLDYVENRSWCRTPEIKTLMAIATDHDENLEMMSLTNYNEAKDNRNKEYVVLKEESNVLPKSFIKILKNVELIKEAGLELHNKLKEIVTQNHNEEQRD